MEPAFQSRIRQLNSQPEYGGKSIVYVMSRDQRAHDNHALLAAQAEALRLKLPLAVVFCLTVGNHSREQYDFMLNGLHRTEAELLQYNIPLLLVVGKASQVMPTLAGRFEPAALYFDFNPLRGPRAVVEAFARDAKQPVFVVDTHNIVPVWAASNKQEYGARTIRPKIHKLLPDFLFEPPALQKHPHAWPGTVMDITSVLEHTKPLEGAPRSGVSYDFPPPDQALELFLDKLDGYAANRNDPSKNAQSNLSPYLHFGQLSSLRVALEVTARRQSVDASNFLEELIVRKELADNYCYYNPDYAQLKGAPEWARKSLAKHAEDPREFTYTLEQLERAQTHDEAWNASQRQLVRSGKMHGYMRMYWAKKVLEWSPAVPRPEMLPATHPFAAKLTAGLSGLAGAAWAQQAVIYLNDFYSIDGHDPSGYTNILWSVAGLHDRPWGERAVYGSVRSMTYGGLRRKFNITAYQDQWPDMKNG